MSFIPIGDRQEEVLQKAICLILSIYHLFFFLSFFIPEVGHMCAKSKEWRCLQCVCGL